MTGTTYIRIDKCSDALAWYADKIGQVLAVERFEPFNSPEQGIPESVYWCREGGLFNPNNYVRASDATLVDAPKTALVRGHSIYLDAAFNRVSREYRLRLAVLELSALDFDAIVVRGVSGMVFGSILADRMQRDLVVVRKGESTHSTRPVEGVYGRFTYVIIDDCVATGRTIRDITAAMGIHRPDSICKGVWLYDNTSLLFDTGPRVQWLNVATLLPSWSGVHPVVNSSQQL